jgi:DNA-binding MarR family transcriptional regulator
MAAVATCSREERIRTLKDAFHALMWIAMRQFSQRLLSFGLTHPQFIALASLTAHKQACTMRDLTNVTFQDPPTMTGIVDRLLKMKLVERTRSETDRRVVLVRATPAGIDLVKQVNEAMMTDELNMYSSLTDDDLTALERLLKQKLRVHVRRYKSLQDGDLDVEIEKLQHFMSDPIHYARLENERNS